MEVKHISHTIVNLKHTNKNKEKPFLEKQAKVVRGVFKDYLDGKGANRISRKLKWKGKAK